MKIKKGIILAGGTGSRLGPLTRYINKHCLPCGTAPMIFYPLSQMIYNNIEEICVVSGLHHLSTIVTLLGSGKRFGCNFTYKVQDEAGGIAEAISLCRNFSGNDPIVVILGDNIFGEPINFEIFESFDVVLFLKNVPDPHRFGVAEVDHLKKLIDIEEKPSNPKSNLAITGMYIYSSYVWEIIKKVKRSERGELEISDVNKLIIKDRQIFTSEIDGWWSDAGTMESFTKVNKEIWENLSTDIATIIEKMINS